MTGSFTLIRCTVILSLLNIGLQSVGEEGFNIKKIFIFFLVLIVKAILLRGFVLKKIFIFKINLYDVYRQYRIVYHMINNSFLSTVECGSL